MDSLIAIFYSQILFQKILFQLLLKSIKYPSLHKLRLKFVLNYLYFYLRINKYFIKVQNRLDKL